MTLIIGRKTINFNDIFSVVFYSNKVICDPASLEILKANEETKLISKEEIEEEKKNILKENKITKIEENLINEFLENQQFKRIFSRASILILLIKVLKGSFARIEIAQFLSDLLNNQIHPVILFENETESVINFIQIFNGVGDIISSDGSKKSLSEELQKFEMKPPGITLKEYQAITHTIFISLAIAAINGSICEKIFDFADLSSALSCEAFEVDPEPFDMKFNDHSRIHKMQSKVASNLRDLLEGSRISKAKNYSNKQSKEKTDKQNQEWEQKQSTSFAHISQYHGAARSLASSAVLLIKMELDSCENFGISQDEKKQKGNKKSRKPTLSLNSGAGIFSKEPITQSMIVIQSVISSFYNGCINRSTKITEKIQKENEKEYKNQMVLKTEKLQKEMNELEELSRKKSLEMNKQDSKQEIFDTNSFPLETGIYTFFVLKKLIEIIENEVVISMYILDSKQEELEPPTLPLGLGTKSFWLYICEKADSGEKKKPGNYYQYMNQLVSKELNFFEKQEFISWLTVLFAGSNKIKKLVPPKGTRDFGPFQMRIREKVFDIIKSVFKKHGAVEIDTPVFELKETLLNKYGDEGDKLIYDLADQGGEALSLRYDLTVPFARFFANNGFKDTKRYHIAKVYRRDTPSAARGRYREFYQCDFDIVGNYERLFPDAECLSVTTEILQQIPGIENFVIKVNHRKLLDGMMEVCGVPKQKFRTICSSIDKLDKEDWKKIKQEMIFEKGLDEETANRIGKFVEMKGNPFELLKNLRDGKLLEGNKSAELALEELEILFNYCDYLGILKKLSFDLSLSRGLDYYTGVVYEAILTDSLGSRVGSIAGGGRYDDLLSMFSNSRQKFPAVGVSIGIERIFTIVEQLEIQKMKNQQKNINDYDSDLVRVNEADVYVVSIGKSPLVAQQKLRIVKSLWDSQIKAEFSMAKKPKVSDQITYALENRIPLIVLLGDDEIEKKIVKVKILKIKEEKEIPQDQLIDFIKKQLEK
ncbi:histidyl-tRNA synthetase [Anaeramoeba ignava]|uniref:histidine--tRNA ligase n=1 Tax=Anaeramoeba ignava TaxID=1746090 RepID=A0A9Q0LKR4_ANAIG|nr:histidyl-tRNA synthetase [Anaeramoeba ignava]